MKVWITKYALTVGIIEMQQIPGATYEGKEYAFFAYAYSKVSEYMKAIDIGEEYLELDTPSISALKSKIEEVLQEEKEKAGATIVDSNGDER